MGTFYETPCPHGHHGDYCALCLVPVIRTLRAQLAAAEKGRHHHRRKSEYRGCQLKKKSSQLADLQREVERLKASEGRLREAAGDAREWLSCSPKNRWHAAKFNADRGRWNEWAIKEHLRTALAARGEGENASIVVSNTHEEQGAKLPPPPTPRRENYEDS